MDVFTCTKSEVKDASIMSGHAVLTRNVHFWDVDVNMKLMAMGSTYFKQS